MTLAADPRLKSILDVLSEMTRLDFSKRAQTSGTGDALDAVASAVNGLGDELRRLVGRADGESSAQKKARKRSFRPTKRGRVPTWGFASSRALLAAVINNTKAVIYAKDREGRYLFVNNRYEQLFNIAADAVKGKTDHDVFPEALADAFRANDLAVFEGDCSIEFEEIAPHDDGPHTYIALKFPLHDRNGHAYAVCGISTDITERKKEELELAEAHRQLKEATAKAVHSERLAALGQLAAGVAHELNQPLNGIKLISQSIQKYIDSFDREQLREDLDEILGLVAAMAETIGHMRIFTRRRTEELAALRKVEVNTLVRGALRLTRQQVLDHGIELRERLAEGLPSVLGDSLRLEQVILNLITNARDAVESCDRTDGQIEIATYVIEGDSQRERRVAIAVKDNGDGIPEAMEGRVFEPFFTTKGPGRGTGLGLSISAKVAEEHAGRLGFESNEDVTVFKLVLPASTVDEGA